MKKLFLGMIILLLVVCFAVGCADTEKATTETTASTEPKESGEYKFRTDELGKYTIVYAADNPDYSRFANVLKARIYEKYEITLRTVSDMLTDPGEYEILIGDTNRYDTQSRVMEYSVSVSEGKFRINVGGSVSAEAAVNYLCESLFDGRKTELEEGEYYKKSLLTELSAVTDGTSVRVMSANILADKFATSAYKNAYYRAEIFAGILVSHRPDVLGLQESDEKWASVLDAYLTRLENVYGISYSTHLDTLGGLTNYTSLLYRSDKFKVENSGVEVFDWWNDKSFYHDYHMRNISWAQLASLENENEKFILADTHWSYRTEHANGKVQLEGSDNPIAVDELRVQCKDETHEFLSSLRESYPDIPIFLVGDFNTSLTFFTKSDWTPIGFEVISEAAKESGTSLSEVPTSGHYDHIFGAGDYEIKLYAFFRYINGHSALSDHPFVYADFAFGKETN